MLGDSVNLSARLMQAACGEQENKILIDSETARSAESKMNTKYYKSMLMKGKSEDTLIYIPLDKPLSTSNVFKYYYYLRKIYFQIIKLMFMLQLFKDN